MAVAEFRFYEELNDFLRPDCQTRTIVRQFDGSPSVKDAIEAIGVPHTEVDLIIVDGESVGFDYHVRDGDRVAVYPQFEAIDIRPVLRLRPEPLRLPVFLVDANLARLVGLLRILGFDTRFSGDADDAEIAATAAEDGLTILTRDRRLLMRRIVSRAYYVRSQNPHRQAAEVIARFDLHDEIRPFSRCAQCNGILESVDKAEIETRLPFYTRRSYTTFQKCRDCGKVYWRGAHWKRLPGLVEQIQRTARALSDRI